MRSAFSSPWFVRRVLLSLVLAGFGLGAAWYVAGQSTAAIAQECRAAEPVVERMAPLARGAVAAVSVAEAPKPAPSVSFQGPNGQLLTLSDFKGRAVLVNLWATWCVPCREEMPALDKLQAALGGPDFEVVAVNVDTRDPNKPKEWLHENGIGKLAYYADPQAKILQVLQRTGHVVGLPTTILVDAQGCEIAVLKGPADWASDEAIQLMRAALGRA